MSRSFLLLPLLALVLSLTSPARAQLHDIDVILQIQHNTITTGAAPDGSTITPERVFQCDLGDDPTFAFNDDPGFDAEPFALPVNDAVGFNITKALRVWNGVDFLTISTIPMTITSGPDSVTTPPTDTVVHGFARTVDPDTGIYHNHFGMTLGDATNPAQAGIYLLEREMYVNNPDGTPSGIADSLPFWYVFTYIAPPDEFENATQWVRNNLDTTSSPVACNPADIVSVGQQPPPDGLLTGDDYVAFINAFFTGSLLADIVSVGQQPPPDGLLTGDDYVAFINNFFIGCR